MSIVGSWQSMKSARISLSGVIRCRPWLSSGDGPGGRASLVADVLIVSAGTRYPSTVDTGTSDSPTTDAHVVGVLSPARRGPGHPGLYGHVGLLSPRIVVTWFLVA